MAERCPVFNMGFTAPTMATPALTLSPDSELLQDLEMSNEEEFFFMDVSELVLEGNNIDTVSPLATEVDQARVLCVIDTHGQILTFMTGRQIHVCAISTAEGRQRVQVFGWTTHTESNDEPAGDPIALLERQLGHGRACIGSATASFDASDDSTSYGYSFDSCVPVAAACFALRGGLYLRYILSLVLSHARRYADGGAIELVPIDDFVGDAMERSARVSIPGLA
jgi:hypothetical protein